MSEIVQGKAVNADRSKQMMELLHRDMTTKSAGPDDQAHGFSAMALSPTDRLWSKAGWTSTARHDVAYIENDQGVKMVIAVFTTGHSRERQLLPAIVKTVIEGMTKS
jgi:hypothetical protein